MVDNQPLNGYNSSMIQRHIKQNLIAALADTPVVLLNGARQTGKSTLAQSLSEEGFDARYVTLDNASVLASAKNDAAGFLAGYGGAVIIDEVQRAPELFMAIKADVDRHRKPGRYLLTGSTNVLLLPKLSESLAGRLEIVSLWPFSQGELAGIKENFVDVVFTDPFKVRQTEAISAQSMQAIIIKGGYPEAASRAKDDRRQAWFESYLTTILQRDIRDLANIEGLTSLPRLLAVIAARSPALLNFAEFSRTLDMPQSTLKRYMALLEATFLIQQLPPWSGNRTKRLVKTAKISMADTGLMAHLLGVDSKHKDTPTTKGALYESFVIMELKKQITWSDRKPKMFHFRTQTGQEVDIVLEDRAGNIVGIEVKSSATIHGHEFKGLRALAETTGKRFQRGIILYAGQESIPFGESLFALPVCALWQQGEGDK